MGTPTPSTNTPSKHNPTFSSPAPRSVPPTGGSNMLSYDSPAVLNMLNEASSAMGGVGMGITMSGLGMSSLGMSASAMGRADEAERLRKLHQIIDIVGAKPGRVSEEGLLALCSRLGIATEKVEGGTWMLLIGDEAAVEVAFKNDVIAKVTLQTRLDEERPELHFGDLGSQILMRSLQPRRGQSKLNVTLERFQESLQKLLTLDQLGSPQTGGVSCYNAIAGVYTSLRKLFEHEKKANLATRKSDERHRVYNAEREVLCKKSGRPRLNGGSCMGLSVEYWMDRRRLVPKWAPEKSESDKEKMDFSYPEDTDPDYNKVYSLTIECESSLSTLYNPVRISNDWISDAIEKLPDANDADASIDNILLNRPSTDWLDPKPTYLDASMTTSETMDLDSAPGRLPNIRFVARFNPPLVVPLAAYMQLYQLVGIEPRTEEFRPTTFVGLALRPGEVDPGMVGATGESTHQIRSSHKVSFRDVEKKEGWRRHNLSLHVPKTEYSRTLESLPFSHPKQIIEILPVLRQYASITALLQHAFFEKPPKPTPTHRSGEPTSPRLAIKDNSDDLKVLQVDMNLSYALPAPRFTLRIPHPHLPASTKTNQDNLSLASVSDLLTSLLEDTGDTVDSLPPLSVTVDVHANAELVMIEQNLVQDVVLPPDGSAEVDIKKATLIQRQIKSMTEALDSAGDLCVWGEWLQRAAMQIAKATNS